MPSALVAALAAPIREVQSLVGPGWSSDPAGDPATALGRVRDALADVAAAARRAWNQAEQSWFGAGADAAAEFARIRPAIYDGDTEGERRWQIRKWSNLILTNPDMLHVGVLPHHDRWGDGLSNLRYVVVDEAHVYRGASARTSATCCGAFAASRGFYGSDPQFLLASATIGNPGELAGSLVGLDFTVIGEDGAPRAERTIALWSRRSSTRSSGATKAARWPRLRS